MYVVHNFWILTVNALHTDYIRERSGSVVEWLTPNRGATGSSLTGARELRCVFEQYTLILA